MAGLFKEIYSIFQKSSHLLLRLLFLIYIFCILFNNQVIEVTNTLISYLSPIINNLPKIYGDDFFKLWSVLLAFTPFLLFADIVDISLLNRRAIRQGSEKLLHLNSLILVTILIIQTIKPYASEPIHEFSKNIFNNIYIYLITLSLFMSILNLFINIGLNNLFNFFLNSYESEIKRKNLSSKGFGVIIGIICIKYSIYILNIFMNLMLKL